MASLNSVIKLAAAALIVSITAIFIVSAIEDKIAASAQKNYEKRSLLAVLEKREDNFIQLKKDYPFASEKLKILRAALPGERDIDEVVKNLEFLAAKTSNDQVLTFDPLSNAKKMGGVKGVGFTAVLNGNMVTFIDYLTQLKKLPYNIEIKNVSIYNGSNISNSNSQLSFAATVYIKNE